jgi:histidinol-phosphatase (PHP family)
LADAALTRVQEQGLVLELNVAGRYKPVAEFYPEIKLLKEIRRRGIPVTLGSDAHQADQVGRDLQEAAQLLHSLGFTEILGFEQRRKVPYALDVLLGCL